MKKFDSIEKILSLESEYDRKHIINTSMKEVPQEILDKIEAGCSLEQLDELSSSGYDIYKYGTQITIHGLFPAISTNRIGHYVNLFQNKNQSIGVKYNAIDRFKKSELFALLQYAGWRVEDNSQNYGIYKTTRLTSENTNIIEEYKELTNRINRKLFIGRVDLYMAYLYGIKYIVLEVYIRGFYDKNRKAIIENLSGMSEEELIKIRNQDLIEKEKKAKEWQEEYDKKRAIEEKEEKEYKEKWFKENPVPDGFVKVEKYTPHVGDIICLCIHKRYSEPKLAWKFFTFTKSFGKIIQKPCDIDGNVEKYERGTAVKPSYTYKETYLKTIEF